ncbi:MAG: VOC family protein [Kofleriaceae bacterium]|nr:VOC family protein [Kofleriaceae bacterium]
MFKISSLTPRLVVSDAARAISFYAEAFGAKVLEHHADDSGHVVLAVLAIGDLKFALTEEKRAWHNVAPTSLGGSPVLLALAVDDADAVGEKMQRAGAKVVFPIDDHGYGFRDGRLVDPFGHYWIVSQAL